MGEWSWEAAFHGSVHTATLAVATVLALFVLVLGSFGNGLVLVSAARRRKKRTNFDLLILNLSAADLFLCVVLAPLYLYTLFTDPPFPKLFCGSLLLGGTGFGLLSLLSIVAIAIHRQARVAGRAKRSLTTRQTGLVLGAVWALSGAGAVGATLHAMLDWRDSYDNCQVLIYSHDPLLHRFTLFFLGPLVLVSFIVIVVAYAIISRAVRAQSRTRTRGLAALYRSTPIYRGGLGGAKPNDPLVQDKAGQGDRRGRRRGGVAKQCQCCSCQAAAERESKAVTMCLVVMVTLVLCWSPLLVSQFIELATGPSIILLQVKLCGIALVFLNSALDPYMYAQNQGHVQTRYGRFCWDVLRCQCASPRRTRFRVLRTRPVGLPRSSLLEIHTPSLPAPAPPPQDRAVVVVGGDRGNNGDCAEDGRKEGAGVRGSFPNNNKEASPVNDRLLRKGAGVQGACGVGLPPPSPPPPPPWQSVLNPCATTTTTITTNNNNATATTTATATTATTTTTTTATNYPGVGHTCRHPCRPKVVMRDVKTLVHKSCCHVHVPSDQSLVES
ncbi:putative G-protein coupled receptor 75 [Babylonia areolata]|uniref:putative G-protein coupled receptor 75 n=1 Tax=Babylonia areolata TaxID=304850 RepID=UPI003FCF2A00